MELVGEYTFALSRKKVWDLMLEPATLKACLPGCEKLEVVGPDEYAVTMKIGIAMIKGTFTGKVKISDKVEPEHYTMSIEGAGPQGQVNGVGQLDFVENGPDSTTIKYNGTANVTGTIARVGARMIQPAAKTIAGQFFKSVEKLAVSSLPT